MRLKDSIPCKGILFETKSNVGINEVKSEINANVRATSGKYSINRQKSQPTYHK